MKSDLTFLQEIMMGLNVFYTTADKLANLTVFNLTKLVCLMLPRLTFTSFCFFFSFINFIYFKEMGIGLLNTPLVLETVDTTFYQQI